ncbi:MAG: DUF547 domain-containing protein [Deltaproteobacteria bacterium]|nr:DUF547 domain-containing protein [Deltaproteobacteria bacterium]
MWAVAVAVVAVVVAGVPDTAALDRVLAAAVKGDLVDYRAVELNRPALRSYLDVVAVADVSRASRSELIAFYVNAYNATVLDQVLVHGLVAKKAKVTDVKGFFDGLEHRFAGQALTLNELEALARKLDPRVHFVINCASLDCPPLRARSYSAGPLEADLERQTRAFLARPEQLKVDVVAGTVVTTQLLEWYAADFGDVRTFLSRHAPVGSLPISFRPYDWRLNVWPQPAPQQENPR